MYICVEKSKEVFDVKGESLGQSGDNALYYLKSLGRKRIYRQKYPIELFIFNGKDINKGLRLFTYKSKKKAQELCDYTNEKVGSNYKVVEMEGENGRTKDI